MQEFQFIIERVWIILCTAAFDDDCRDDYIKPFADINAMWHAKRKSSLMEIMEIPTVKEKKRERESEIAWRFRHPWPYSRLTSLVFVPLPSITRSSARVGMCACFWIPYSADLTLNRMISSGRQSGRRLGTSHRRAGRDRQRMEIGEPERRSPAAADPGPGAAARRQSRSRHGCPGSVMLRPRRSAYSILEYSWRYDECIEKNKMEKNYLLQNLNWHLSMRPNYGTLSV